MSQEQELQAHGDMNCDNDYINMTPTRCSVLITSESGDELISLRGHFIGRAEQHILQHCYIPVRTECTTSEVGWWSSTLDPVESRVRTGLCGRSCCGLRIQQPSLVDANELPCFQFPGCCSQRIDT